jgi:hypothetical protein
VNPIEALRTVARLEQLGVAVRSPELENEARRINEFYERGGNRAMRRAAAKQRRSRGRQ